MSSAPRHLRPLADPTPPAALPLPTDAAAQRLAEALSERTERFRTASTVDFTMIDALLRMNAPGAAADALEDSRSALVQLAEQLHTTLAEAAEEREAAAVVAAAPRPPDVADPEPAWRVRASQHRWTGPIRRTIVAATGAATLALALVLPSVRETPRADTELTSADAGSSIADSPSARGRITTSRRDVTDSASGGTARSWTPSSVDEAGSRPPPPVSRSTTRGGGTAEDVGPQPGVSALPAVDLQSSVPAPAASRLDEGPPASVIPLRPDIALPGADPRSEMR